MKEQFHNWLTETKTKITRPDKYSNTIRACLNKKSMTNFR